MVRLLTQQGQLIDWHDDKSHPFPDNLVLLDLLNPARGEELEAEKWLEYQLPTVRRCRRSKNPADSTVKKAPST